MGVITIDPTEGRSVAGRLDHGDHTPGRVDQLISASGLRR